MKASHFLTSLKDSASEKLPFEKDFAALVSLHSQEKLTHSLKEMDKVETRTSTHKEE